MRRLAVLVLALIWLGFPGPAHAGSPAADAELDPMAKLAEASAGDGVDHAQLEAALVKVDALLAKKATAPRHYVRGRLLANLGRHDEALDAYRKAVAKDPGYARAWYSIGIALASDGHGDDAIAAWEKAATADPKHTDALYNLGQAYYGQKKYDKALARWQAARRNAPDDFQILNKVVQAHYGLGQIDEGERQRAELLKLWTAQKDKNPQLAKLTDYVMDQFDLEGVPGVQVWVWAPLLPPDHFQVLFMFELNDGKKLLDLSVRVETSDATREAGHATLIAVHQGAKKTIVGAQKTLPSYPALKATVVRIIQQARAGQKLTL